VIGICFWGPRDDRAAGRPTSLSAPRRPWPPRNPDGLRRNDPLPRRWQRVPRQGWAMRRGRPHPQVGENLLDHRGLLDEGDDPHGARTAWADEGIDLVNLLDQPCPGALARKVRLRSASSSRRGGGGCGTMHQGTMQDDERGTGSRPSRAPRRWGGAVRDPGRCPGLPAGCPVGARRRDRGGEREIYEEG